MMPNAESLHPEAESGQLAIIREKIFRSYMLNSGKTHKLDDARIAEFKKQFQESVDAISDYYNIFYELTVTQGDRPLFTITPTNNHVGRRWYVSATPQPSL